MSADNWTVCPRCKTKLGAEKAAQLQKAQDSYGVVPADEFEQLMDAARVPLHIEDTLREDYGLGIFKGQFYVSYKARCTECGWGHTFKFEEPIKTD